MRTLRRVVARLAFSLMLGLSAIASARAQAPGPFFEPDALSPQGYEIRVGASYHDVTREDFARPIFLLPQPLQRIRTRDVGLTLELRLSLTPALAAQLVLPWRVREAAVRTAGLQVGRDETLAPRSLELASWGLGDPRLALAYRLLRTGPWAAYAELGATIPIDDNPGSPVLADRVPLGTGQHELFAGLGGTLARPIGLSLSYRFAYHPGEHAAFLVRRTGTQSYTSGALAPFFRQRVQGAAAVALSRVFSVVLAPAWSMVEAPVLVERGFRRRILHELFLHELEVAAAVRAQLDARNRVELRWTQPLIAHWDLDPFFPISIPARGLGITWQLVGS